MINDSMIGAGLVDYAQTGNSHKADFCGFDPALQSIITESMAIPPDSSNTKSAIPLNNEA